MKKRHAEAFARTFSNKAVTIITVVILTPVKMISKQIINICLKILPIAAIILNLLISMNLLPYTNYEELRETLKNIQHSVPTESATKYYKSYQSVQ